MVFGGHGHDHWHVQIGASYWLTRPGSSEVLRRYSKVGYCFFDQSRLVDQPPEAPIAPTFGKNDCDGRSTLELEMGLSPGFADPYHWTLPDQRLLVSGLTDGVYRLWADADPNDWFRETDEENNLTWVDLRLTLTRSPPRAEVVAEGPRARPPGSPADPRSGRVAGVPRAPTPRRRPSAPVFPSRAGCGPSSSEVAVLSGARARRPATSPAPAGWARGSAAAR